MAKPIHQHAVAPPEGVAFSSDGTHVYVGNFASKTLSIVALEGKGVIKSVK